MKKLAFSLVCLIALLGSASAFAQGTGSIAGTVIDANGDPLPGVTVEASGDVLPRPRVAITGANGRYDLRLLPPGNYTTTYVLTGFREAAREVRVLLQSTARIDVTLQLESVEEVLEVTGEAPVIDTTSAEIKTAIDDKVIDQLPVGQEYRDIVKLIPGVQYTEDSVRGPSAGGSGQDNVYQFDGVNVGLPLFGTLSADPSSHDIEQVTIVKGGAKAIDFNRSGGFTINSVSKSGTNRWRGAASYQVQTESMTSDRKTGSSSEFEEDKDWAVFNIGGPIAKERLFFYASYYRPTIDRGNRSNLYGPVPNSEDERDELFGKLTFTPTDSLLFHTSWRDSENNQSGFGVTEEFRAGSTSDGNDSILEIGIFEGSAVLNNKSFLNFKYTDFTNETGSLPDNLFNFQIADDGSVNLDVNNLDQQGLFLVPRPIAGNDAYNDFIQPLIDRYGFVENGVATGGGIVGGEDQIDNADYFRESWQISYDLLLGKHDLHFGYQWSEDEERLSRTSNGWGIIEVPSARTFNGEQVFYEATFEQQSLPSAVPGSIDSGFESQSFEINDTIRLNDWTLNIGFVASNDELFGEGLAPNPSTPSGFELSPGTKYKMYEIDWDEMISPRLGATWSYNQKDTLYASYARYYPAASSLPRAASWARNLRRSIRAYFRADGSFIGTDPVRSSSGKYFDDGLDPRSIDEFIIGHSRQMGPRWTGKAHVRYRYGMNFWEDTNNNARSRFNPPPGIPTEDYIENLNDIRFGPGGIGGSSYVIAELDGAFTKYYEASFDAEWRGSNAYFKGSYVWSHYYGNFDQDNSSTENDLNIFVGSSFIADGFGRQLWNFREGNLRGDRRHQLKLYGFYNFDWNGSVGAYAIFQSGQPWEAWDRELYRCLEPLGVPRDDPSCTIPGTGSSSDTSRYAEPAGSRTTSDHYQLDLNYTQNFKLGDRYNVQLRADVYNVFDKQTGYNIQNRRNTADFGEPRDFFDPRRLQVMVKFEF